MSNQYFNFYYSPTRQGYDTSTWRTLLGAPAVTNNRLVLSNAAIIHYGDILRADAFFNFNTPAPAVGLSKRFGFYQPNLNAYAYFNISGAIFTAECSNGTTTTTSTITWQSDWTNTNTEFRVKWESGIATFFVDGIQQAQISDASVSGDPMSIYVTNESNDSLLLNYVDVKQIQSYLMNNESKSTASFELLIYESDQINLSESVTILIPTLMVPNADSNLFDGITVSESVTAERIFDVTVNTGITLTENITMSGEESLSVFDSLEITESVTMAGDEYLDVNDTLNITESVTMTGEEIISVSDAITLTDFVAVSTPA